MDELITHLRKELLKSQRRNLELSAEVFRLKEQLRQLSSKPTNPKLPR